MSVAAVIQTVILNLLYFYVMASLFCRSHSLSLNSVGDGRSFSQSTLANKQETCVCQPSLLSSYLFPA